MSVRSWGAVTLVCRKMSWECAPMAPKVIAVDEIGSAEDIHALEYAMQCGCTLIASVHGRDMEEISEKPVLSDLVHKKRFERYVVLENRSHPGEIRAVFDQRGSLLCCGL